MNKRPIVTGTSASCRPIQPDLFGSDELVRLVKQGAIQDVEDGANPTWLDCMLVIGHGVSLTQVEFTADDLWREWFLAKRGRSSFLDPPLPDTRNPAALGAVMKAIQKKGWAEPTNRSQESKRVIRHGGTERVWVSLIYRGPNGNGKGVKDDDT